MSLLSAWTEFYEFRRGGAAWRYTTTNKPLIYLTQTYLYEPIKRSDLNESIELARNTLDLTVPVSLALLDQYRGSVPMEDISIALRRMRKSDSTVETRWIGVIGSVEFKVSSAVIHGLPPMASLRGLGLQRCWQKSCPLVVYSTGLGQCNANAAAMRVNAILTTVSGEEVHAAAIANKPDGWFAGGWIQWNAGTATERRQILAHVGDKLTLLTPALVDVGTVVAAYPGCDQSLATCQDKFNNAVNYGGQPWIPVKNPFGADPIY